MHACLVVSNGKINMFYEGNTDRKIGQTVIKMKYKRNGIMQENLIEIQVCRWAAVQV